MDNSRLINRIIKSPVFTVFSFLFSAAFVYEVYQFRIVAMGSFRAVDFMCMGMLLLSLVVTLITYFDKKSDTKGLIKESLPALFFFIAFMVTRILLRG